MGPTRDPAYGGLGLDYSYSMAIAEEMGNILAGGIPMAIGVHTGQLCRVGFFFEIKLELICIAIP